MYSESVVPYLKARIGFGSHPEIADLVSVENKDGETSRVFSSFHKLATIKNLYATVDDIDMSVEDFNTYLDQLKTDAVVSALNLVLHFHSLYKNDDDYTEMITEKASLFDEIVGNNIAISAIEQIISTSRMNDAERSGAFAYEKLKIELEGVVNEKGAVRAKGLNKKLRYSIRKAQRIIFPTPPTITSKSVW